MEKGKGGVQPFSFKVHHFFSHPTSQNSVTWPHLALKKSGFLVFILGSHETNKDWAFCYSRRRAEQILDVNQQSDLCLPGNMVPISPMAFTRQLSGCPSHVPMTN